MSKKLVINSQELTVLEVYPYRYDYGKGKEVLRIKIAEANHSFEEIKCLDNTGLEECPVIEYWDEGEKKNEYVGYNADFSSNYVTENDVKVFSIEVMRTGPTEVKLAEVEKQLTIASDTVGDLTVLITELMFGEDV